MKWQGINVRTSDVDSTSGVSADQANARLRVDGELQRRWGMIPSGLDQQSGPILIIASAVAGNFITFGVAGGEVGGYSPLAVPTINGPKRRKPIVVAGDPAPPSITLVTATPPSPKAYTAGLITFVPTVLYDGLSGALTYQWQQTVGPAAPSPSFFIGTPYIADFDGFCIPGPYSFNVQATTQFGGFVSNSFGFGFTVT